MRWWFAGLFDQRRQVVPQTSIVSEVIKSLPRAAVLRMIIPAVRKPSKTSDEVLLFTVIHNFRHSINMARPGLLFMHPLPECDL
jgi:hypothetical protein